MFTSERFADALDVQHCRLHESVHEPIEHELNCLWIGDLDGAVGEYTARTAANHLTTTMCFRAEVSPLSTCTRVFDTPNSRARNAQSSALALPFSGTAPTLTFTVPSAMTPANSVRALFGTTLTCKVN